VISFPNAKINLGLNVIEKRPDGYHNISSCFYPINLTDALEIMESGKPGFSASGCQIPGNKTDNLVIRAFELLKNDFDLNEVAIHLHKSIPTGAGLGGGSSDGAFALKMLNTLFKLFLDDSILADYALLLGSDCPFFIYNQPMIAGGRGEVLKPTPAILEGYYLCLVMPDQTVSTKEAYQLINPAQPELSVEEIVSNHPVENWPRLLKNDFEEGVLRMNPGFLDIKEKLYDLGAVYASMTGSGSAFYGIFRKQPIIKDEFPSGYSTWVQIL
jgi:4-diphosphocytidyl-2-C-methyl-D-erythritol kinase